MSARTSWGNIYKFLKVNLIVMSFSIDSLLRRGGETFEGKTEDIQLSTNGSPIQSPLKLQVQAANIAEQNLLASLLAPQCAFFQTINNVSYEMSILKITSVTVLSGLDVLDD